MTERLEQFSVFFRNSRDRVVETLQRLVSMETPSGDRARLDMFAEHYAELLRDYCDRISIVAGEAGARIRAEVGTGEKTVLLLAHMDTVWSVESERRPVLRRDGEKLFGPGVFDMKSSLALMLFAFEAYARLGIEVDRRVVYLVTPDEEVGSGTSRDAIEREAAEASVALVLEPPLADGGIKTERKGVGVFRIEVRGREAHAGVNPGEGVNAIHELALQIARLIEMNDSRREITVNVGLAGGGIKDNVIPGNAWANIDFRALTVHDCNEIADKIKRLEPIISGAELIVEGEVNRPPMEETPASIALAKAAQEIAAELGVTLTTGKTGGGSDGSFTAAKGVPTIDGLGLDGNGAHCLDEHVLLDRIPFRGALLAELILRA